jgi:hypothetical protein
MASQADDVGDAKPSGKARGIRLVKDGAVSRETSQAQIPVPAAAARQTEVIASGDIVELQWVSVVRWLGDRNTKGLIGCLKAERMIDALIRGGDIRAAKATAEDRQRGFPDLIGLKRARIKCFIAKQLGTNKNKPIYAKVKLTDRTLLWASRAASGTPNPIGPWQDAPADQIPHLLITVYANWVRDLPDDTAREAWLFDILKTISWTGEEGGDLPFELVGHDIQVNEDTIAIYGVAVNDTLLANRGMKNHAHQLGFPEGALNPAETHEKLAAWLEARDALLYRPGDGAVLGLDGDVLYYTERAVLPVGDESDDEDGPEENPDDPGYEDGLDNLPGDEDDEDEDDEA